MSWLQFVFGSDGSPIVQYVVIFAAIFTALAVIVFVVRRLTGRGLPLPGRGNGRGRQPRLGIVDVYELDRARQLILLRRDNVEHLLLVGGPNDVVIERNIQRGQRPVPEVGLRPETINEPLPDPLAGAGRLPEPPRSLPESASRRSQPLFAEGFEMPVVVPAPVPGSGSAPPVTLPLDATLLGGDEPGQDIPVPARAPLSKGRVPAAPAAPPAVEPASPAREPFSARRLLRRSPQPAVDPGGIAASETRPNSAEAQAEAAKPVAPPVVPAERRAIDAEVLSDMARQLQAALARPGTGVTPVPATVSPDPHHPAPTPEPSSAAAPVGASHAAVDPIATEPPAIDHTFPHEGTGTPAPERPPVHAADAPPEAEPAAAPPAPSPPESAPKTAANPFSVEEIEAEFARLLGRPLDKRS